MWQSCDSHVIIIQECVRACVRACVCVCEGTVYIRMYSHCKVWDARVCAASSGHLNLEIIATGIKTSFTTCECSLTLQRSHDSHMLIMWPTFLKPGPSYTAGTEDTLCILPAGHEGWQRRNAHGSPSLVGLSLKKTERDAILFTKTNQFNNTCT